jgi:hypothetical protein
LNLKAEDAKSFRHEGGGCFQFCDPLFGQRHFMDDLIVGDFELRECYDVDRPFSNPVANR